MQWRPVNDKRREGYGIDSTLQTSLILFCSSKLRILGGCPEAFRSARGTPGKRSISGLARQGQESRMTDHPPHTQGGICDQGHGVLLKVGKQALNDRKR